MSYMSKLEIELGVESALPESDKKLDGDNAEPEANDKIAVAASPEETNIALPDLKTQDSLSVQPSNSKILGKRSKPKKLSDPNPTQKSGQVSASKKLKHLFESSKKKKEQCPKVNSTHQKKRDVKAQLKSQKIQLPVIDPKVDLSQNDFSKRKHEMTSGLQRLLSAQTSILKFQKEAELKIAYQSYIEGL